MFIMDMEFVTLENLRKALLLARQQRHEATQSDPFDEDIDHAWLATCELIETEIYKMKKLNDGKEKTCQ